MNELNTIIVGIMGLGLIAQTGEASTPSFDLTPGTVWTYQIDTGDSVLYERHVGEKLVDAAAGKALEIRIEPLSKSNQLMSAPPPPSRSFRDGFQYNYLALEGLEFRQYQMSSMIGPGLSKDNPIPLLKGPIKGGTTWTWSEPFRGQTMGEVDAAETAKLTVFQRAEILSTNDSVKVVAGTYKAVHVRVHSSSDALGKWVTDNWYAPKVGLIRSVTRRDGMTWQKELAAYHSSERSKR